MADLTGQELGGADDDFLAEEDLLHHEHAETDLRELEKVIDSDLDKSMDAKQESFLDQDEVDVAEPEEQQQEEDTEEKIEAKEEDSKEETKEEDTEPELSPEEERYQLLEKEIELLRLQNEQTAAERAHYEKISSKQANRAGMLEQELRRLSESVQGTERRTEDFSDDLQPRTSHVPSTETPQDTRLDRLTAYLSRKAMESAATAFQASHPELTSENGEGKELREALAVKVQQRQQEFQQGLTHADPEDAEERVKHLLESVYIDVQRDRIMKQKQEAIERRRVVNEKIKEKKKEARVSSSDGGSASDSSNDFNPWTANMKDLERKINKDSKIPIEGVSDIFQSPK